VVHFLNTDPANCASPHLLFDCQSYLEAKRGASAQHPNPLIDYLLSEQSIATEGACQIGWGKRASA
jgi:hypothetical protein